MASKEELLKKNKDELQELAKEQELEGRSGMNKEELAEALADDSSSEESESLADQMEPAHEGGRGLAQEEDQDVASRLAEERAEEAEDLNKSQKELEEEAEAEEDDAADEEEAPPYAEASELKAPEETAKQEDVINFPPPLGDEDAEPLQEKAHSGLLGNTNVVGSEEKSFGQRAQFYTDGLSGAADSNLERAYALPEVLQSNDPVVREAGDQSESEGEEKSEEEQADAEEVKSGERLESDESNE